LWANNDIDRWCPAANFISFRLGDASSDRDEHIVVTGLPPGFTHQAEASDFGIDLLGRPFADMACVQHDEISVFGYFRAFKADGGEHVRHAGGVVHVHLAAIGLDKELARQWVYYL